MKQTAPSLNSLNSLTADAAESALRLHDVGGVLLEWVEMQLARPGKWEDAESFVAMLDARERLVACRLRLREVARCTKTMATSQSAEAVRRACCALIGLADDEREGARAPAARTDSHAPMPAGLAESALAHSELGFGLDRRAQTKPSWPPILAANRETPARAADRLEESA